MSTAPQEVALGPGAEFDAIRELLARWGTRAVGIGDDAAVLDVPRGEQLVASVDASFERKHFIRGWLTPREIGYRAVTAALSDLAAMAARPLGVLIALGLPDDWQSEIAAIADGIGDAVAAANTVVRGGNISGATALSITTTVFGSAFTPLARSGARPGDRVYVTGTLGGAEDSMRRIATGRDPGEHRKRFAQPSARIEEGQWLSREGACAAIDISDGLVADMRHLAAASGVGVDLDASSIPRAAGVSIDDALVSGEEYELIVTSGDVLDARAFRARFGISLTEIGRATSTMPGVVALNGSRVADVRGHDHLSRR